MSSLVRVDIVGDEVGWVTWCAMMGGGFMDEIREQASVFPVRWSSFNALQLGHVEINSIIGKSTF
jgi:hypothetical protein